MRRFQGYRGNCSANCSAKCDKLPRSRPRWRRPSRPLPPGWFREALARAARCAGNFSLPNFWPPVALLKPMLGRKFPANSPVLYPSRAAQTSVPAGSSARLTSASLASREAWVLRGSDAPQRRQAAKLVVRGPLSALPRTAPALAPRRRNRLVRYGYFRRRTSAALTQATRTARPA